ncbi:MAG: DUF4349 domain-containing protein [Bacteroidetes bacterium]|nr:DUF4349 domain-containing protein [Bacteroidota bacterium]
MKSKSNSLALLFILTFLLACNHADNFKQQATEVSVNAEASQVPPSIEQGNGSSPGKRKFIRTADLKFMVKDVSQATSVIEQTVREFDGFVVHTNLQSTIDNKNLIPVSADSSLETTTYTVNNGMILRVPNNRLDTTLKAIAALIDYLDYRTIKAEDVALQILTNKMTRERIQKSEGRILNGSLTNQKKVRPQIDGEDFVLNHEQEADEALLNNLSLEDRVNYSTINLSIYQRQVLRRVLIANDKNIEAFKPGLGSRIMAGFASGWVILENILVFFAEKWSIIVLLLLIVFIYRFLIRKTKTLQRAVE